MIIKASVIADFWKQIVERKLKSVASLRTYCAMRNVKYEFLIPFANILFLKQNRGIILPIECSALAGGWTRGG
jgi:hypothetical protein